MAVIVMATLRLLQIAGEARWGASAVSGTWLETTPTAPWRGDDLNKMFQGKVLLGRM